MTVSIEFETLLLVYSLVRSVSQRAARVAAWKEKKEQQSAAAAVLLQQEGPDEETALLAGMLASFA